LLWRLANPIRRQSYGGKVVSLENVKPHQLDEIERFANCTGLGFLLVCFERLDLGKTFAVSARWFRETQTALLPRRSIPFSAFEVGAADPGAECIEAFHGEQSVPINFGPAAFRLATIRNGA